MGEAGDTTTDFYTNEYDSAQNTKEIMIPDINSGSVSLQNQTI